ncbi:uncharacterized protein LOC103703296 [Phoenix dactylifera]|uniref:Uncharacterized protein LOC103703296 n=1 Tax=Phoenix dactylifera TaxID=42345 RepID=A0A8B8J1W8_PHODC|nr:uncharacterized protein LOC103703296 [Phoenix dactylifera]
MSTKVRNGGDAVAISAAVEVMGGVQIEVEFAECECCGLTEECTPAYIARVRERHNGRWVCGLCGEAIKDEICRAGRRISTEEALDRHMSFSRDFLSASPPANPAEDLIAAMRNLLRRSLDSPRTLRSTPTSPHGKVEDGSGGRHRSSLARSESCFPSLAR